MSSTTVISHSEAETEMLCEMRHYYGFGDETHGSLAGLEPLNYSDALYRGISGHHALHAYYKALIDGASLTDAAAASVAANTALALRPHAKLGILADLNSRILPRFFESAKDKYREGWRPLHAEKEFRLSVTLGDTTFVYPFKPDLIATDPAGNWWVWDHKFVYNFYSQEEISLLPQIPKYIGALRALGYPIKGGYYNQLRHREVKDLAAHVRMERFTPSDMRVQNAFRQQAELMIKIGQKKLGNNADWKREAKRTLNGMVCKTCSFKHLCAADLNGQDTTLMRKVEFQGNTYGYGEEGE